MSMINLIPPDDALADMDVSTICSAFEEAVSRQEASGRAQSSGGDRSDRGDARRVLCMFVVLKQVRGLDVDVVVATTHVCVCYLRHLLAH
jgi:hypothetical protein